MKYSNSKALVLELRSRYVYGDVLLAGTYGIIKRENSFSAAIL